MANNICILVSFSGDIQLGPQLILTDFLYVPQFNFYLISVSTLTNDSQLTIHFFPNHFVIQDVKNLKMIGKGSQVADLYILNAHNDDPAQQNSTSLINSVSVHTWHNRLGHQSNKCLTSLKTFLQCDTFFLNSSPCCICPLAKKRKLSFVSNNNMSALPFDLIYCDLWGPYHVTSYSRHQYFLTLVDDCNRFTWIF